MKCPHCNHEMTKAMHFEKDKDFAYNLCKHCQSRTHKKRIHYEEFEKGYVNKED